MKDRRILQPKNINYKLIQYVLKLILEVSQENIYYAIRSYWRREPNFLTFLHFLIQYYILVKNM